MQTVSARVAHVCRTKLRKSVLCVSDEISSKTFWQKDVPNFPPILGTEKYLPPPTREQDKKIFRGKLWLHPTPTCRYGTAEKLCKPYLPKQFSGLSRPFSTLRELESTREGWTFCEMLSQRPQSAFQGFSWGGQGGWFSSSLRPNPYASICSV